MSNLQYLENAVVGLILSRKLQHLTTEDIRSEAVKLAPVFEDAIGYSAKVRRQRWRCEAPMPRGIRPVGSLSP